MASDAEHFFKNKFYGSGPNENAAVHFTCYVSLDNCWLDGFSGWSLILMTLTVLKTTGQVILQAALLFGFV